MRRAVALATGLLALAAAGPVAAGSPAAAPAATVTALREPPRNALSLPLLSLSGLAGVGLQYEHQLEARRFSVAVALAARGNAGGDYRSLATSASIELRYWLKGRAVWCHLPRRAMVGWFAGARLDASRTTTHDRVEDRDLSASQAFAETLTFGYRFAIRGRVELTPSLGFGLRSEIDTSGRLPSWTRSTFTLGFTAGWLFD